MSEVIKGSVSQASTKVSSKELGSTGSSCLETPELCPGTHGPLIIAIFKPLSLKVQTVLTLSHFCLKNEKQKQCLRN